MKKAYCFGHISTGKLYRIQGEYPQANGYAEYIEILDNYAGEALSTAVVLSRLGVTPILEGNWIGDTIEGKNTIEFINKQKIEASTVQIKPGYQGVHEIVISDAKSRTVFGRYCDLLFTTRQWEIPSKDLICSSAIACADPSFGEASICVAQTAYNQGIPFVAIDADYESELIKKSTIAIISEDFLQQKYNPTQYDDIFREYCKKSNGLVIFTFGEKPLWYGRDTKNEFIPFTVPVIDTAGAGDSFRAGVMYGVLQGFSDTAIIKFASAVAASVIQTSPGVVNFKGIDEVQTILNTNKL